MCQLFIKAAALLRMELTEFDKCNDVLLSFKHLYAITATKLSLKISYIRGRSSNQSIQSVKVGLLKSSEAHLITLL